MTYRKIVSWGLIAGLTYTELQDMAPGFVIDAYILRRNYDGQMHGVRRGEKEWQATSA